MMMIRGHQSHPFPSSVHRVEGPGVARKSATPITPFPTLTRDHPPTTSMARDHDSNRRTPPAPPTTTVRRAQRPRCCAQERSTNHPMPNHAHCHHQQPQRRATTTMPTSGRAPTAPPQPSYTGPKGPGTAHKSAAPVTESPTVRAATTNTHDGATATTIRGSQCQPLNHPPPGCNAQALCKCTTSITRDNEPTTMHATCPAVPSPPPHRQAHGPGTTPENGHQLRKARARQRRQRTIPRRDRRTQRDGKGVRRDGYKAQQCLMAMAAGPAMRRWCDDGAQWHHGDNA